MPPASPLRLIAWLFQGHPWVARGFRGLLLLMLIAITVLALKPARADAELLIWDKLAHALAFAALAVVAGLASPADWLPRSGALMVRIAAALLGYGLMIELLQALTPTRSADGLDLVADGIGIAAGLLAWWAGRLWASRQPAAHLTGQ